MKKKEVRMFAVIVPYLFHVEPYVYRAGIWHEQFRKLIILPYVILEYQSEEYDVIP